MSLNFPHMRILQKALSGILMPQFFQPQHQIITIQSFFLFYCYSTLFNDSTISIFFSFWCINRLTIMETPTVSSPLYRKLIGLTFLPNITASTFTVKIIYLCRKIISHMAAVLYYEYLIVFNFVCVKISPYIFFFNELIR